MGSEPQSILVEALPKAFLLQSARRDAFLYATFFAIVSGTVLVACAVIASQLDKPLVAGGLLSMWLVGNGIAFWACVSGRVVRFCLASLKARAPILEFTGGSLRYSSGEHQVSADPKDCRVFTGGAHIAREKWYKGGFLTFLGDRQVLLIEFPSSDRDIFLRRLTTIAAAGFTDETYEQWMSVLRNYISSEQQVSSPT